MTLQILSAAAVLQSPTLAVDAVQGFCSSLLEHCGYFWLLSHHFTCLQSSIALVNIQTVSGLFLLL